MTKIMKEGNNMNQNIDINEIAQKLHLPVETVSKSESIKNTYYEIKNDTTISNSEREEMYTEMSAIFKNMTNQKS